MKGLMLLPLLAVLVVSVYYVEASPTFERDTEEKLLNLLARVLDDQNDKSTMKKDRGAAKEEQMKKDGLPGQGAAKKEQMKKDGLPGQLVEKADNGMENILEERLQATYELRLVGGNDRYEGRVEVRCPSAGGSWGTVCDDGWGNEEACVVCRQLGFPYSAASALSHAAFGQGSGSIWWDNVACTGAETNIGSCSNRGWGRHDCYHSEDAGVRCQGLADGDLRLVGGAGNNCGRVEVFYSGEWGTICDDYWDAADARVVCRQLGLPCSNARVGTNAYYGQGSGRIWLDDVSCTGSEGRLDQCGYRNNEWGSHNCDHTEDAVVFCE